MPALDIPDTKFILPTASTIPISINNGMSMPGFMVWEIKLKFFTRIIIGWSDVYGLHHDSAEDKKGMDKSAERVKGLVMAEINQRQVPASRIVVAGSKHLAGCQ